MLIYIDAEELDEKRTVTHVSVTVKCFKGNLDRVSFEYHCEGKQVSERCSVSLNHTLVKEGVKRKLSTLRTDFSVIRSSKRLR